MSTLTQIRNFTVYYSDIPALDQINLDINCGETLAVIGESGSGKSTLALGMAGLLPANACICGEILWPEFKAQPATPGRDIGFIFQDPSSSLDPVITIGSQLVEVIRAHKKIDRAKAKEQAIILLERVHIPAPSESFFRYPHQFSGGQKQRIAIALAIAATPRLLIADEPTSALDTIVQREIISLLQKLQREDGLAMMFITHDIALASGLADRVAVLRQGRLVEAGRSADVLENPQNAYTRALIDAVLQLEASHD